jgi:hypothetical protein
MWQAFCQSVQQFVQTYPAEHRQLITGAHEAFAMLEQAIGG